jgi:hypothetical protein
MDVHYKGRFQKGQILVVSETLRSQFSKEILMQAYDELVRRGVAPFWYRYQSRAEFEQELTRYGVQRKSQKILLSELYQLPSQPDHYYFFITKKTMSVLPTAWQKEVFKRIRRARSGVSATLNITTQDNLSEVAKKYAGNRDYRPIERYLQNQLRFSQNGRVSIPLEKILNSFIRDRLNLFADRDGPNCVNCALSANQKRNEAKERYQSMSTTRRKLLKGYRFILPGEQLQTGDVLAYLGDKNDLIHAVNYLGDASFEGEAEIKRPIVFTKNGFTRASPYLFSLRTEVDSLYKSLGAKRLLAFRKAENSSEVISSTGKLPAGAQLPYYEELVTPQVESQSRAQCFLSEVGRLFPKLKR